MTKPKPKKIIYVDMDNVLVDFESGIKRLEPKVKAAYRGHLDDVPGIFALMDPVDGAVEAFHILASQFDVYILSTAPWENPSAWADKLIWVKKHLGDAAKKRLILTHRKDLNRGDFLIDDREKHGAKEFGGKHIHFKTEQYPDWEQVIRYFIVVENLEPMALQNPLAMRKLEDSSTPQPRFHAPIMARNWTKEELDAHSRKVVRAMKEGLAKQGVK